MGASAPHSVRDEDRHAKAITCLNGMRADYPCQGAFLDGTEAQIHASALAGRDLWRDTELKSEICV